MRDKSDTVQRDYAPDYGKIPPHGRWQHFDVGGTPRVDKLMRSWTGIEAKESCRRLLDLFVVSVLLDAGADPEQTNFMLGNYTALHLAVALNDDIAKEALIRSGASLQTKSLKGETPMDLHGASPGLDLTGVQRTIDHLIRYRKSICLKGVMVKA